MVWGNSKASLSNINMAAIEQKCDSAKCCVPFAFNSLRCASNRRKFFTLSDTTTCGLVVALELALVVRRKKRKENVNEENRSVSVGASFRTRTRLLAQTSQPHECCLRAELTGTTTGVRSKGSTRHFTHQLKTATLTNHNHSRGARRLRPIRDSKGVCALVDTCRTGSPTTGGLRRRSVSS